MSRSTGEAFISSADLELYAIRPRQLPPAIGQVVWYWPADGEAGVPWSGSSALLGTLDPEQPMAAIVAFAHPGGTEVNLTVMDHWGDTSPLCNIPLMPRGLGVPDERGVATWSFVP